MGQWQLGSFLIGFAPASNLLAAACVIQVERGLECHPAVMPLVVAVIKAHLATLGNQ
jgi:hypothetical protein